MKELRFTVEDPNKRAEILQAVSGLVRGSASLLHVPPDALWQIWTFTGPRRALDEVEAVLDRSPRPPLLETEVIASRAGIRSVATRWREPREDDPPTVERLLARLGWAKVPVQISISDERVHARALSKDRSRLEALHDDIRSTFEDRFRIALVRAGTVCTGDGPFETGLDPESARLLNAAIDLGYYDRPRRCTLRELADELDLSKSAVSRRLRRIEEQAVGMLQRAILDADPPSPDRSTARHGSPEPAE